MKILIDGYNLGLEKGTGVATYARNLSYELHNLGHSVSVLYGNHASSAKDGLLREVSFFDGAEERRGIVDILTQVQHAVRGPLGHSAAAVPMTGAVISRTFEARLPYFDRMLNASDVFKRSQSAFKLWGGLSRVRVDDDPDLVHWTYPLPLTVAGRPNLYTVHDIVPLRLPYTTLDHKRRYLQLLRKLDRSADHFVTVSECSKRDMVEILGISPDRITNTYQSVDIPASLREKSEAQVAREVEGLAGVPYKGYFLFWGSIEPKKNIGRMIEAYLVSKVDAPLVIIGAQAWRSKGELKLLGSAETGPGVDAGKRIVRLPYASFGLLVSLIRGARAALFPSLYEGFGLPALEAMLLGTPVICSNTSSLPEVAGDAAFMVDPYDTVALTSAIRTVDADEGLRDDLGRRGVAQAAQFSPAAYRERLDGLYRRFR
ncbi:glycosyltransferase family 1 protein [Sphingomonas sp. HF-S3]|uniref:Glycosyltransferase family 1 protein n=1 Tax=Sphingomonas rustica TaxID=3103142 RepID=A0ABV0BDJ0_9SPHN